MAEEQDGRRPARASSDRDQDRDQGRDDDPVEPRYGIGGAAPARSALTLRAVLASFGLLLCAVLAAWGVAVGAPAWLVVLLVVLAVVAVVDLVVIGRRKARGEPG